MVNEPSVFEPLKFYCMQQKIKMLNKDDVTDFFYVFLCFKRFKKIMFIRILDP